MMFGMCATQPDVDLRMVLFNADGSAAEISGNGIRCLGQAALRLDGRREGVVVVGTAVGVRTLHSEPTERPDVDLLRVDMGEVTDGPPLTAAAEAYPAVRRGSFGVGNPHLVLVVGTLEGIDPAVDGPALESGFEGGMNVHFVVVESDDTIRMVHWERGAGVTEACGSGATAAGVAVSRWGLTGRAVDVHMPGGTARVEVGDTAALIGPAAYIAAVEVE
jgi:diaminopimelate epimerase